MTMWCNPEFLRVDRDEPTPDAALLCHKGEWIRVLRRLRSSSLLSCVPVNDIAKDPSGKPLAAGAFGIIKDDTRARLIVDRRPANYHEATLPSLSLPHSVCFTRSVLAPHEALRLSDYTYETLATTTTYYEYLTLGCPSRA